MASRGSERLLGRPARKYSQAERLIRLYDKLRWGGRLNPGEEAGEQGVDRRTIQRDFKALLRALGPGKIKRSDPVQGPVRYSMPGAHRPFETTLWQVLAISVGARMTGFLSGRSFHSEVGPLLDQLRASLKGKRYKLETLEKKIHVVGTGQKDYRRQPEAQQKLSVMLGGLIEQRPVEVGYHSHQRRKMGLPELGLRIHALCLTIHNGAVYFVVDVVEGEDVIAGKRILLALDRLTRARLDEEEDPYEAPVDFDPGTYFRNTFGVWTGDGLHTVRLRIDELYAPYVTERFWHVSQVVEPREDGGLEIQLRLGRLQEVQDWILAMGEHAEVLEPPELRVKIRERLTEALARYQN